MTNDDFGFLSLIKNQSSEIAGGRDATVGGKARIVD